MPKSWKQDKLSFKMPKVYIYCPYASQGHTYNPKPQI